MVVLALLRVLIIMDCVLNMLLAGSIHETLSSRAHRMRERKDPYFSWLAPAIDWIFRTVFGQAEHCQTIYQQEQDAGGALAWLGLRRT